MEEDFSSCRVCLSQFDEKDHVPMLLICGHSFCMTCATALPLPITCPLCRIVTPGLAADLKKNFALLDVLPILFPPKLEEKCGECKKRSATVCCGTCGSLCQRCSSQIHAYSIMKTHTIVPFADKAKVLVPVCLDHGEKALLFCFQHSSLICLLCKDYGSHKTCSGILPLAEAANERVQKLNKIVARAEAAQKLERYAAAIKHAQDETKQKVEQARVALAKYFEERRLSLNVCERALMALVDEEEKKLDAAFTEQRFELARACSALQAVATQAKRVCVSEGSKYQILQSSNIEFPDIQLLRDPCFSSINFNLTFPVLNPSANVSKTAGTQIRCSVEKLAANTVATPATATTKRKPVIGQRVEARFNNSLKMYPGTVHRINADHTFAIRFDDGDQKDYVPLSWINGYP